MKAALSIPVFGNGDVFSPENAATLLEITGCDGVAVARGSLGNPWLIPRITKYLETGVLDDPPDDIERLKWAYMHCLGLLKYKGPRVGVNESRRHLTQYTKGISGAAPFRNRLTQIASVDDAAQIMAELALTCGGTEGEKRFLLAVEQANFKNSEHPGEGNGNGEGCIQPPVYVGAVAPVAVP